MLFKPELVAKVLAGEKTQTRREWRESDAWLIDGDTMQTFCVSEGEGGRERWFVGKSYALQPGRGKRAVGRILLTEIRYCARAADISEADARAEGFESAGQFREVYARINGAGALEESCWALTFRRAP
jgi:hypothetical protein